MQRTETLLHIDVIGDSIPREIRGNMMRNLSLETMDVWFSTGEMNSWSSWDHDDSKISSSISSYLETSEIFQNDDLDLEAQQVLHRRLSEVRISNEIDHLCEDHPISAVDSVTRKDGRVDFIEKSLEALEKKFAKLNSSTPHEETQDQISVQQNEGELNSIQGSNGSSTGRDVYRLRKRSGKRRCSSWTNEKPKPFYKPIAELAFREDLLNSTDSITKKKISWQQKLLDEILCPNLPKIDYRVIEDQTIINDSFSSKLLLGKVESFFAASSFSNRESQKSVSITTHQRSIPGQRPRSLSLDTHVLQCTFTEGISEKDEDSMLTTPQANTLTLMMRFALSTELKALY